jgi:hypothetical protein
LIFSLEDFDFGEVPEGWLDLMKDDSLGLSLSVVCVPSSLMYSSSNSS